MTDSGLQYKDLRDGSGGVAKDGARVTVDWDGYTLGYYGRPFEARNKVLTAPAYTLLMADAVSTSCHAPPDHA